MYVTQETVSVSSEVISLVLSVRQEAETNEVGQLTPVVANDTVRLFLFTWCEPDESRCDVHSMLAHKVQALAALFKLLLVFICDLILEDFN